MLVTSDSFESTVPGVYNGCVFYSFSGSMCSGYIAATEACKNLSNIREVLPIDGKEVASEIERIFRPMNKTGEGIDYRRFELAIRQVMNYYMGFVRNQQGMETALERLNFIETYLDKVQAKDFRELMRTNESIHLLKTCQLATRVTMERKETGRAIYRRSDYPGLNPDYAKPVAIWQEGGEPCLAWF
jgi:adenylylsulfate reductase subunit A